MKYSKITILSLILLLIFALAGCGNGSDKNSKRGDYPVTVSDVTISSKPESVVVLSDSLADIILAESYEISLKARTTECTQSELSSLPTVGSKSEPDINAIIKIDPQVVLTDTELSDAQNQSLSKNNIKVVVLKPATSREALQELYKNVGKIMAGGITGAQKGEKVVKNLLQTLDDITRMTQNGNIVTTAVYLYDANGSAATGDTFAGKLIDFAGATNIANSSTNGKMNLSEIRLSNPGYIFCSVGSKNFIKNQEVLAGINAVKNNKIYEIDSVLLQRQGRTLVQTVSEMAKIMFPKIANDGADSDYDSSESTTAVNKTVSNTNKSSSNSSKKTSSSSSPLTINSGIKLSQGDSGNDVLKMQQRLDELNYMHTAPSGSFTSRTTQAVKDFQFLNGISATGIANEATLKLLFSSSAKARPDPAREK